MLLLTSRPAGWRSSDRSRLAWGYETVQLAVMSNKRQFDGRLMPFALSFSAISFLICAILCAKAGSCQSGLGGSAMPLRYIRHTL